MVVALELILIAGLMWTALSIQLSGWWYVGGAAIYLLLLPVVHDLSAWAVAPMWIALLALTTVTGVPLLRRRLISAKLLERFQRMMPPVSNTEREALEAGSTWWEADLFNGHPDWNKLLSLPAPSLSVEEQAFLDGPAQELCRLIDDWQITEELHDLPAAVWDYMKQQRFFGMIIPRAYGGLEFSAHGHSSVVMKLATRSITAAVTVMVPNSLGPAQLLLHYGTQEQKDYYLPRLARGEEIPCFALTGPEAGSDAASMPDRGVVCREAIDGKEELAIRLNWEKRYITLGPVATVLGLAFRLCDPDHLLGPEQELGITLALIPTDTPGVDIGRRHFPLNQAFMNGPTRGEDVVIPMRWVIGGQARIGQGWRMLMECLADGRSISLPALGTGAGKLACRATGAYAAVRKQFKMPIGEFEGVAEALGRIAGNAYAMDAARCLTTLAVDSGEKPAVASAIVKYHLTERMRRVVDDAMDVHGGRGICMGPRNYLARVYQAIPISITVEGANILTRSLIIFGQGALRCHRYLLREIGAAERGNVKEFDAAVRGHLRLLLANLSRGVFHGLTGARLARVPSTREQAAWFRDLSRMSAVLAISSEAALLTLGGALKRRESLSARLGDVLSLLYIGSAALKRFRDQGSQPYDRALLDWVMTDVLHQMQQKLFEVYDNFPVPWAGRALKWLLFPYGGVFRPPSDHLLQGAAKVILRRDGARERLTAGMYLPSEDTESLAQLEAALESATAAKPILSRLRKAIRDGVLDCAEPEQCLMEAIAAGLIDEREASLVRTAAAARRRVIDVDEFPAGYWKEERNLWKQQEIPSQRAGLST
jgi:acyl-CoA dehydrogenase